MSSKAGAAVLVSSNGEVTAAAMVTEPTQAAWQEAEGWLTEDGTHGRTLLRLTPPEPEATFRLGQPLALVLADGWSVQHDKTQPTLFDPEP